jgi:carboxypeptidase C (cathepsin A)
MGRWLSENGRWGSPVFIAGESYGGYRVGRLARSLQETPGIGLNGAILISPALEITSLAPTDYDVLGWIDRVPTMAAAALHHGRSRAFRKGTSLEKALRAAEEFATATTRRSSRAAPRCPRRSGRESSASSRTSSAPLDVVVRGRGARRNAHLRPRAPARRSARCSGSTTRRSPRPIPFPDRDDFSWPDPTLSGISPAYTMAVNRMLRSEIGVETDREYSAPVVRGLHVVEERRREPRVRPPPGATDDFRYGMALNPHMKAFITHGQYDLVTPYYASDRLRNLMRLDPQMAGRLTVQHYGGGHMFYAWEESRHAFASAIATFVADAI